MKFTILKRFICLSLLIVTFFYFNSCKKDDAVETLKNSAKFQQWLSDQPKFTTVVLNQKLQTIHNDGKGDKVSLRKGPSNLATGTGCADPIVNGDEPEPQVTLISWASTNPSCGSYFSTYAIFKVSTLNAIVLTNPNNSLQHSVGRILVKNTSSGTSVFTNNAVAMTASNITYIGADPDDPTNRSIYNVSWTCSTVPTSAFSGSNTITVGLYFYTECLEESKYPYTVVGNISNLGGLTACNIVSSVFINPGVQSISGVASCSCCTPDLIPAQQEIKFSNGYDKIINSTDTYVIPTSSLPTGHTYSYMYRNIGSNGCSGPWLAPMGSVNW